MTTGVVSIKTPMPLRPPLLSRAKTTVAISAFQGPNCLAYPTSTVTLMKFTNWNLLISKEVLASSLILITAQTMMQNGPSHRVEFSAQKIQMEMRRTSAKSVLKFRRAAT